jgi:multifunctional beta-oxidation protein
MAANLSIVGKKLDPSVYEYSEKDVILYALGVGCGREDLRFVYEGDLKVLPTFAVVPAFPALFMMGTAVDVNPMMILHGEQRIELYAPIPTAARLTTTPTITGIYDKVKGALVIIETETVDAGGKLLFKNVFGAFARGAGGFGGDRGPSPARNTTPSRGPDRVIEMATLPQQALLYRLSGDVNPLHADPAFAKMGGFDAPILHGLCTFGYVGRAILGAFCDDDPARFKDFEARFVGVVYPGETIVTEMWREDDRILVRARTKERGELVINNAAATVA